MELLKKYQKLEKQINAYFSYLGDWCVYPLSDDTEYFWCIDHDVVYFAETIDGVHDEEGINSYKSIILRGHSGGGIYRGKEYTMVAAATQFDGNNFMQIFDNSNEVKNTQP